MLRSPLLLHASTSCLRPFNLKKTDISKCRDFAQKGRVSDVLKIMGPVGTLFPTQTIDSNVGLLRKCIRLENYLVGSSVHGRLVKFGMGSEMLVPNAVLDMYAKMGFLDECLKLFEEMQVRDVVSWCILISGYVRHGLGMEAFWVFKMACGSDVKMNHFVVSSILKGCSGLRIAELGLQVHGLITKCGLGFDRYVEVGLVDMYAKCGELGSGIKLFYEIPIKTLVAWNAMICGYVHNGFLVEAVQLCIEMCKAGFVMDLVTLRVVECVGAALEQSSLCKNLHAYSIKTGLNTDSHMVAEHVRLLARHGEIDYMRKLFTSVKRPDASLFSLVISGFNSNNRRAEAVKLAQKVLTLGLNMYEGVLVNILNLCSSKEEGTQVHTHILKTGHDSYISVSNALITMYSQLGMVKDANSTFCKMPVRDEISWTAIMTAHVQNLQFEEALKLFCVFQRSGLQLDQYPLATMINACAALRVINQGQQFHSLALKLGIQFTDFLNASLLLMYAKCGFLEHATRLFSHMPSPRGLVPINVMLAGFCWNMQPENAIELFHREYQMGMVPDGFSFATVLSACADSRSIVMGGRIHSCITKSGYDVSDTLVGNAMIKLYLKSETTGSALKFFHGMKRWDSNSYAIIMLGCVQTGSSWAALRILGQMHQSGLRVNFTVLTNILRVCIDVIAVDLGKQLHASVIKMGFKSDVYIEEALVEMQAKFEEVAKARVTTDGLSEKSKRAAFDAYEPMRFEELLQDDFDFLDILVHGVPVHKRHVFLSYGKCEDGKDPLHLLERMVIKGTVPWSTILSNKKYKFAYTSELFQKMVMEG